VPSKRRQCVSKTLSREMGKSRRKQT
jgi:hypothetical protein